VKAVAGAIDLYWLPLGAGGHSVRLNGRAYEWLAARRAHRAPVDLYHAALEVHVDGARHTIEMTPVGKGDGAARGVVGEGPVGSRLLRRLRWFRYELRCWRDGVIPDVAEAVASPVRITNDAAVARRMLGLVPQVPRAVWGRDEFRCGDMWNSNSVVTWLLARSGLDVETIHAPHGGRAPGWSAGIAAARDGAAPDAACGYSSAPGRSPRRQRARAAAAPRRLLGR
jgi:hypothetical protein